MVENDSKKIVFAPKEEIIIKKQPEYVVKGGNDWNIVAKKFFGGLLASFIGIGIPFTINFLQTEDLSAMPAWFITTIPVIVALLIAAKNAWDHRLKITKVET